MLSRPESSDTPTRPRRALLVCAEYGPHDHTGGFRWRAMVRALADAGWTVDVVAAGETTAEEPVPGGGSVVRVSRRWPLERLRARRRARHVARTEDATDGEPTGPESVAPETVTIERVGEPMGFLETVHAALLGVADLADGLVWSRRATRAALQLADTHDSAVVVATSPDHLAQRVGAAVAARRRVPYVADYRDPWFFGRGPALSRVDPVSRVAWRRLERTALRRATAVVDIAEGAQRAAIAELRASDDARERRLAELPRVFIASGWDAASEPAESTTERPDPEVFRVVYTGWLWPFMPLPALLLACGRFRRERFGGRSSEGASGGASHFLVELVGVEPTFRGVPLAALARGAGLDGCFARRGRVARAEAARVQRRAAVSVAFDSVVAHGLCIPSKLYHCARHRGVLLPIGRLDGAMAEEAAKVGVETTSPDDLDGIVSRLHEAYERWRAGDLTEPVDRAGVFDARHRGREMVELLESIRRGERL